MTNDWTDAQLDQMLDQTLAFARDLGVGRVWVNEALAVEPTPRGEWVVADYSEVVVVVPVGGAFFATREDAWEFANR